MLLLKNKIGVPLLLRNYSTIFLYDCKGIKRFCFEAWRLFRENGGVLAWGISKDEEKTELERV